MCIVTWYTVRIQKGRSKFFCWNEAQQNLCPRLQSLSVLFEEISWFFFRFNFCLPLLAMMIFTSTYQTIWILTKLIGFCNIVWVQKRNKVNPLKYSIVWAVGVPIKHIRQKCRISNHFVFTIMSHFFSTNRAHHSLPLMRKNIPQSVIQKLHAIRNCFDTEVFSSFRWACPSEAIKLYRTNIDWKRT